EDLFPAGIESDHRDLAARAVQVRLHNLEHESGGYRGVECVAALFQHRHAGRRGEPVGRCHHAEGSGQLRPGREGRTCGHWHLLANWSGFPTLPAGPATRRPWPALPALAASPPADRLVTDPDWDHSAAAA